MAQILVRDLDDSVVQRLKKRAQREGRSLQAEAKSILEEATAFDMDKVRRDLARLRESFGGRRFTDSVELIREDRDR